MQLLSVATARSVWLFDMNDLNPTGKSFVPEMMWWLKERYNFQTVPTSPQDLDKNTNGLMFKQGDFRKEGGAVTVNFGIYTDGMTADTWSSTKDSDLFLEDVLRSGAKEFGLVYSPEMIRSKRYISEVIVRLATPLRNINPKLDQFCEKLSNRFGRIDMPNFEVSGLLFSVDSSQSSYKPPGFLLERKIDAPFSERRYYSKSPFTTTEHLQSIEEIEKLLAG